MDIPVCSWCGEELHLGMHKKLRSGETICYECMEAEEQEKHLLRMVWMNGVYYYMNLCFIITFTTVAIVSANRYTDDGEIKGLIEFVYLSFCSYVITKVLVSARKEYKNDKDNLFLHRLKN
jgi:hypothetical protein